MTEVQLAQIITGATARLLGVLAGAGTRQIDVEPRTVIVWHVTRGGWATANVVISRTTGRVLRCSHAIDGPHTRVVGRGMARALEDWAHRVRVWR